MFGFSSLRCIDCEYLNIHDKNKYGEAYCTQEREYVSLDSYTCRSFTPNFYVMTAYCKINNLPYDCEMMVNLIKFRDEFMLNNEIGRSFLKEYELVGPKIASSLQKDSYISDLSIMMKEVYIEPILEMIKEGRLYEVQDSYIEMIDILKERYGYQKIFSKGNQKQMTK